MVRILLVVLLAAPLAMAQAYQPVTAKTERFEYKLGANGAKTLIDTWQGVFLRAADGTTLSRDHLMRDGKPGPDRGVLREPNGRVTELDWAGRKAIVVQPSNPQPASAPRPFAKATGPHRRVNGVDCIVIPVASSICEGKGCHPAPRNMSWECASQQYGTLVYMVQVRQAALGQVETVQETYDFKPGDPDPAAMRVPEGFAVSHSIQVLRVPQPRN